MRGSSCGNARQLIERMTRGLRCVLIKERRAEIGGCRVLEWLIELEDVVVGIVLVVPLVTFVCQ